MISSPLPRSAHRPLPERRLRAPTRPRGRLVLTLLLSLAAVPLASAQTTSQTTASPPAGGTPVDATAAALTPGFLQAIDLARQGPTVQLAALAVQQAQARLATTFGNVSATVQAGYSQRWGEQAGTDVSGGAFDPIALDAQLNVVPLGPAWDARAGAERDAERARLALEDARHKAATDAADAYLRALRAQQQVALDARAVTLAEATQAHVDSQGAAGDATPSAVLAAQLATSQARTTQSDDTLTLEAALADLSNLLGRAVTEVAGEPPAATDPGSGDIDSAIARRSDVMGATLAVADARANETAALRSALPSASLGASLRGGDGSSSWSAGVGYGTATYQPDLSASFTPPAGTGGSGSVTDGTVFTLSLGVKVPLDSALPAAMEVTRLATRTAAARLQQTQDAARLAILSAQRSVETRLSAATLAGRQRGQRAALLDEAQQRLALGLVAAPEVAQAQLDLDQADLALHRAQDAALLARMALATALGLDPMEVF